jgi:hypothetical protein
MRRVLAVFALLFIAVPLLAVDLGRADGTLVIDGNKIPLQYAYAVDHQKNLLSNKNNETRIILTDKPLADGAKLDDIENAFPDGVLGVVFTINPKDEISHVFVANPNGTYDGGYWEGVTDYNFKRHKSADRGTLNGAVSSKKVTTNTMTFYFDADFAASVH